MLSLLILLLPFTSADVIRTVYCKNLCNDYLHVPESKMPACPKEDMKMNECGTVITCDWSEAEKDKVRPIANATSDFTCCYRSQIKEKGDCDSQVEALEAREPPAPEVTVHPSKTSVCADATVPWMISAILSIIVMAETGYLLWCRLKEPISQKVAAEPPFCQRPLYTARPLLDQRLLA